MSRQRQQKTLPQPEQKAAADHERPGGQQQQVAGGMDQRISHRAPRLIPIHVPVQRAQQAVDGIKPAEREPPASAAIERVRT